MEKQRKMKIEATVKLNHNIYVYVVVQFYPWFSFYFTLCCTHYQTLQYTETKGHKNWTKDKIKPQHMYPGHFKKN